MNNEYGAVVESRATRCGRLLAQKRTCDDRPALVSIVQQLLFSRLGHRCVKDLELLHTRFKSSISNECIY
jgi:hypothetical protein